MVLLTVVIVSVLAYQGRQWWQADAAVKADRLQFAVVEKGPFSRKIQAQGRIIAAVSPQVFASAQGAVDLNVKPGDLVQVDDVLARIDSPELASQLSQEQASLDALDTNIERRRIEHRQQALRSTQVADLARMAEIAAKRELRRAEAAWGIRVISRQDFEKAQDDVERAQIENAHAAAAARLERESLDFELKALELERDRQALLVADLSRRVDGLVVRSPVAGMVGTVEVSQRDAVEANQALMSVVDLTAFEVDASISQSYAERLSLGMTADIQIGISVYRGRLRAVSPEVANNSVQARIRFDGDTPTGLRQNQRATVELTLDSVADALTLPRGAFIQSGGGRSIYVVNGDTAERRAIRLGASGAGRIEVLSGLAAGDNVIISSHEPMRGADRVLIAR
ncbi:MAG: efflux RND transporter periplasmic adaptor subunit [Pseudomonadota bacterium]